MKVKEIFIKCPNCNRLKNANYTNKSTEAKADCICGTKLTKKVNQCSTKIKK